MWIQLPSKELKNLADICAIVPDNDNVCIEHELRESNSVKRIVIAHTRSLAHAQRIVDEIARQIDAGVSLVRVPVEPPDDETEIEDDPFLDLREAD
jgi:hypothetical protein